MRWPSTALVEQKKQYQANSSYPSVGIRPRPPWPHKPNAFRCSAMVARQFIVRLRVHGRSAYQLRPGIELRESHRSMPRDTAADPLWFQQLPISCSWQFLISSCRTKDLQLWAAKCCSARCIHRATGARLLLAFHDGRSYKVQSRLGSRPDKSDDWRVCHCSLLALERR